MLQFIAFALLWAFLWFIFSFVAGIVLGIVKILIPVAGFILLTYTVFTGYLSYKTIY